MKKSINDGVDGGSGYEFQKHCALFIYLDKYPEDTNKNFFICLEHHDDFVFAYLNNKNELEYIETYQSKKNTSHWALNEKLIEPLIKILSNVEHISNDEIPKIKEYKHILYFITNAFIELKKGNTRQIINETKSIMSYTELEEILKNEISNKIYEYDNNAAINELKRLHFQFIDFGKNYQSQFDQLVGQFSRIFGNTVNDHSAAISTLLSVFRRIELTYNQNETPQLLDKRKRITSDKLSECINIITEKQMAFKLWRENGRHLAASFEIPVSEQKGFEFHIQNSFDLFKDRTQVQHQKIRNFVFSRKAILKMHYDELDVIDNLIREYKSINAGILPDIQLRAAFISAYIEMREENGEDIEI